MFMKSPLYVACVGLFCSATAIAGNAEPTAACRANAQAALAAFTHGDYDQAVKHFAPNIAANVTPGKLKDGWIHIQGVAGDFRQLGALQSRTLDGHSLLDADMDFSRMPMAALVDCDAQDRITTFRIVPANMLPSASSQAATPTSATGIATTLNVTSPYGPLPGTLVLPKGKGPFPAVLLVGGSGNHDRDETLGPNKPFRDLADGLAAAGIASLRVEKRTHVYAPQAVVSNFTLDDEVTDDALTALKQLAAQPGVDPNRVFVLGHSLGAFMAPRIGQRDPQLAGVIMMAAPTRFDIDLLIRQTRRLAQMQGASADQLNAQLGPLIKARDALTHADAAHPPAGDFFNAPASYWLSARDYDPVATAKHLNEPMLILQGAADFQVFPPEEFAGWQAAFAHDPRVKLVEYPGLSHLFMPASNPPSPKDYFQPAHMDPRVIRDIADWIKAQPAHS
jgi:dienelactone hydrolase